jgi:(1->4)-alpha-D-glucan 1-alpha-D-glucosylmutase
LEAQGSQADHVLAFSRRHGDQRLLVLVPRLPAALLETAHLPRIPTDRWEDTRLPVPAELQGQWRDVLTDDTLTLTEGNNRVGEMLRHFPGGVFWREAGGDNARESE